MHDVFISYSFSNKHTADAICHYFEARDLRCWYAPRDVDAAKDFRAEIMNAIASSKCFVLVYTNDSNHSRDVMNEITAAFNAKIPILPLRIEDVEMEPRLAFYLNGIHWLDALTPPMENNIRALYKAVCKIVGKEFYEPIVEDPGMTAAVSPEPPAEDRGIPKNPPEPAPAPRKNWLIPAIAGAVAVLVLAVIIALAGRTGPTTPDPTLPTASETGETVVEAEVAENTLMKNTLRKDTEGNTSEELEMDDTIFNIDITRRQVRTITFLDTLSNAPANASDASALGNGKVKAWAVFVETADVVTQEDPEDPTSPTTVDSVDLYDLYIAAEGGVCAPANSNFLFAVMPNLTSIDFGTAFSTEQVQSMSNMFRGCRNLQTLDLSGFVTDNVNNMTAMFQDCTALTALGVSNFKTHNVTAMNHMFYGCVNLAALDVSGFVTDNVNNMRSMFYECKKLTVLEVSNFKTHNVNDMSHMFWGCEKLAILDVSDFVTDNVNNMRSMFCDCKALTKLDVSNFKTHNVTDMSNMFYGCKNLTALEVSNFKTHNVTAMNHMFYGCENLADLDVSGFVTDNVNNMKSMFYGCKVLTDLDVSDFNTSNVTDMSYMFADCASRSTVDVSHFDTSKVTEYRYFMNSGDLIDGQPWETLFS